MARVNVTGWLVVFLCCAVFVAIVGQSGIAQTTATLSQGRFWLAATSSGDLVFFGGGVNATPYTPSDRVDIYDLSSGSWTTATLSIPRIELAAASSGNLVFFGGGSYIETPVYDRVDIYNVSNGSWSTASLSQARHRLAATSVGTLVLFGGGMDNTSNPSNVVDIYNVTINLWTTATLSQKRSGLGATSVTDRWVLFGGGRNGTGGTGASNVVDIFDLLSGMWNTTTLSQPRGSLTAASVSDFAFFVNGNDGQISNLVDIFNTTTYTWSTATLSQARRDIAAASIGDIVAFGGGWTGVTYSAVVDMYNVTSNIWFTASLSQPRAYLAATSSINKIFFGGGYKNSSGYSNTVDIFDIPLPPPTPSVNSALIGGLIGSIVGVLLIGTGVFLVVILIRKRRKRKGTQIDNSNTTTSLIEITTKHSSQSGPTNQTQLLETSGTFTKYSQISMNEIAIVKELGEGSYGKVCLGKWRAARVALKFCKNKEKLDEFINEMKLMIELPPHPNVVQVFGVSLDGPQPVIVMEYCAGGSLDTLLFDSNTKLSDEQKLRFVRGIALGMLHLHEHNIVHRDLAARNILLTGSGDPKISDFGMSRILQKEEEGKTKKNLGPIRWMAPESLSQGTYSKKSDVWSFGIVVYEIVARREPHTEVNPLEVGLLIRDRHLTPKIPSPCPPILREVMQLCWQADPNQRPSFKEICRLLDH